MDDRARIRRQRMRDSADVAGSPGADEARLVGGDDRLRAAAEAELAEDVVEVRLDGGEAENELGRAGDELGGYAILVVPSWT